MMANIWLIWCINKCVPVTDCGSPRHVPHINPPTLSDVGAWSMEQENFHTTSPLQRSMQIDYNNTQ